MSLSLPAKVKITCALLAVMVVLIVTGILWSGMIGHNDSQNWQVCQSITGKVSIIDSSGYYFKGFATIWTYPRAMQAYYSASTKEGGPQDDSIRVTFNDGGTAHISSFVKIQLPTDNEHRMLMHQDFNANPANVLDAVRSHLTNCIKSTGPMMSASENQASRKAEFNQVVEEQLAKGLFEMRRTEVELKDVSESTPQPGPDGKPITTEKKAHVMATEVVLGDNGKPVIVQASPLDRYRIGILQFSVTETQYDEQTLAQFAAKKESYLKAEQAKAQRQEEYQQRLMVTEKGLRQVAEIKAEENQKKERALIQATQAAEVAVITKTQAVTAAEQKVEVAAKAQAEAETLKKIAQIKADTAEIDKKATISAAEAKQKEIELGGGLAEKDRILATIKADRDAKVAAALAGIKVPGVVIVGGDGKDGKGASLTETLMNLLLLRATGVLPAEPRAAKCPN
jgi:hypothetical protein